MDSNFDVNLLTSEIFSILEYKFLFQDNDKDALNTKLNSNSRGKIRILSIDGRGTTGGILAAKSLSHLEACLRLKHGDPDARVADFFDVAAGSGIGGILAALLFTKGKDGRPIFTADQALNFLVKNRKKYISSSSSNGGFGRLFGSSDAGEKILGRTFGESTLKDSLKPVLIPCYDLSTRASFLFSRADALEIDSLDFILKDVCMATSAVKKSFEMRSVDNSTNIVAVDGGVAMNNPTAAAITHVLNNKQEFPFCEGVEDLLVVSLGNGEPDSNNTQIQKLSKAAILNIAGEGVSDMVDQAVSMSFGQFRTKNYVRIQGNGSSICDQVATAEQMLKQRNVESVLFRGKKMVEKTNFEKLELFAEELMKENERRKTSLFPTVFFKQVSPRTSSATVSTISSSY